MNTVFTSNCIDLGTGTGDITLGTSFCVPSEICLFCTHGAVKTICLQSGQKLHLCQTHLDQVRESIGNCIHHHYHHENPWVNPTPYDPIPWTPQPVWCNVDITPQNHYETICNGAKCECVNHG